MARCFSSVREAVRERNNIGTNVCIEGDTRATPEEWQSLIRNVRGTVHKLAILDCSLTSATYRSIVQGLCGAKHLKAVKILQRGFEVPPQATLEFAKCTPALTELFAITTHFSPDQFNKLQLTLLQNLRNSEGGITPAVGRRIEVLLTREDLFDRLPSSVQQDIMSHYERSCREILRTDPDNQEVRQCLQLLANEAEEEEDEFLPL